MGSHAKYAVLARTLETRLRAGHWGADTPLPTNQDLQREYRVSLATVRSALTVLDAQGLLRRVPGHGIFANPTALQVALPAPAENPFGRCHLPAPEALQGRTIAIVGHRWRCDGTYAHACWERLLRGGEYAIAHGGGRSLVLQHDIHLPPAAATWTARFEEEHVHGVLALGEWWRQEADFPTLVAALRRRQVPIVQVYGDFYPPVATHSVVLDGAQGIHQVVRHLQQLGHRQLGFLTFVEDYHWAAERTTAMAQATAALGLPPPVVQRIGAGIDQAQERARLLALAQQCTAVVAVNDDLASKLIAAATSAGYRVPGDLSVTGFDDDALYRDLRLTTVGLPLEELAVVAVNHLVRGLQDDFSTATHLIQLTPRLLVRGTTGAPPGHRAPLGLTHRAPKRPLFTLACPQE